MANLTKPSANVPIGTATVTAPDGRKTTVEIKLNPQWEQAFDKLFKFVNANVTGA
jgi:hypothetical protein